MTPTRTLMMFTDGGARGNPGPAGIGVVLKDAQGKNVATIAQYIGERTNNQAEYEAVLAGLKRSRALGATELRCFLDSQLVVEQLSRRYKVKDAELGKLFVQCWNTMQQFTAVHFQHIPREQNKEADALVNRAIDEEVQRRS